MKRRFGIYGAVGLIMIAVWAWLLLIPHLQKRQEIRKTTAARQTELAEVSRFTLQMPSFLEAQERLESQRIDLESKLFAKAEILHLFQDLKKGAQQERLTLLEITPPVEELLHLQEVRSDTLRPAFLNLSVTVEGDYLSFGRFVQALEAADYTREINRCIITGSPDGSRPLQCMLSFKALLGSHQEAS